MKLSTGLVALTLGVTCSVPLVAFSVNAASAGAAADAPPSIVEDFSYPDADRILAERGIKLIRGSGTILLADCPTVATNELIWVATISGNVCFRATAATGYLSLEIGEVYSLRGDTHNTSATVTVDGETEHHELETGQWHGVGVGEDETKPLATLLELKVSP